MNTTSTFELNSHDLEDVNGGFIPIAIAVVAVASAAAGYIAGRSSKK